MTAKKPKRIRWEVRWSRKERVWSIYCAGIPTAFDDTKLAAVKGAAWLCRDRLKLGELSELTIKNKDGRIGKGSSGHRSYGLDPRRAKG